MQIFSCDQCGHPVFFENVQCLHCGSALAFIPERVAVTAIEPVLDDAGAAGAEGNGAQPAAPLWRPRKPCLPADGTAAEAAPQRYRQCENQVRYGACNFTVAEHDPNPLCACCRQTYILPDLSMPANLPRWTRIETAKRRLYYTLLRLGLADPRTAGGPSYQFLADLPGGPNILTGHCNGVITLNVAEADDDERVRRRVQLFEPYRTLLGHMRHESGHYYWDRLVKGTTWLQAFRELFGNESVDYMQSLQAHYAAGEQRPDWRNDFVSAYAAAHPWEDWAETWAHYLHMVDLLETAASYGTRIVLPSADGAQASRPDDPFDPRSSDFDQEIAQWVPVTLLLNSLNRSLGQDDAYPFALSDQALRKLRFVHEVITAARTGSSDAARKAAAPQPAGPADAADTADAAGNQTAKQQAATV